MCEFCDGKGKRIENGFTYGRAMIVIFWMVWIVVIGAVVYGFYYLDNDWLEDK